MIGSTAALALLASACGGGGGTGDGSSGGGSDGEKLAGIFKVDPGECSGSEISGSYFRMVQSGGTIADGPFVANGDSSCKDKAYTALSPGTDGGLSTVELRSHPDPAFDKKGNGLADSVIQPQPWFAVAFACTTSSPDPQSKEEVGVPEISHDGSGNLTGTTSAYSCAWNGQFFNQGAPKPDGSTPGETSDAATGTYDPDTGAFTLEWTSTIVGGAFDKFTGVWHLEGTFEPSS